MRRAGDQRTLWVSGLIVLTSVIAWRVLEGADVRMPELPATGLQIAIAEQSTSTPDSRPLHPVIIREPKFEPMIDLGETDPATGRRMTAACSTCHSGRKPNATNSAEQLDEFHQGLTFKHGPITCISCHNSDNYDTLRLADNAPLQFDDVMTLCAQCHGPQARDYRNGSHGGMTGYWDLTRGPRIRNNCVDCHDPHAPQFPVMRPVFKPHDRFLTPAHESDEGTMHE